MEKPILSREQARQLIREKTLHNLLKNMSKDVFQETLEAELDEKLGYSKYDYKNKTTANSVLYKPKGYSDEWIEKRILGIAIREQLTDENGKKVSSKENYLKKPQDKKLLGA